MDGALPPPAGFGLPDEKLDVEILAGTAVTTFIALTAVGLRFWVRSRIVRSLGWDDYWILAAFVSTILSFSTNNKLKVIDTLPYRFLYYHPRSPIWCRSPRFLHPPRLRTSRAD
jgi:hypothetical protein